MKKNPHHIISHPYKLAHGEETGKLPVYSEKKLGQNWEKKKKASYE